MTPLGPAPTAPGALGQPPAASAVLDYLAAMNAWTARLRTALDDVDARARLGGPDAVLTADVTLAYALGQSIETRLGELTQAWDSGRVGPRELDRIGQLLWSRLEQGVSLAEACVLAEALLTRLAQRLENDPARSTAATLAKHVRSALKRCGKAADALGDTRSAERATALAADLDRAVATPGADAARAAVAAVDAEASALERDLIVAGATRASEAREREALDARLRAVVARAAEVRALSIRCASEIVRRPVLGIPDPAALGPVPDHDRLARVEAALREAAERFAAPLEERADLSGLLEAYRAKAAARGGGDDAAYGAARALLDERPCDLDRAREAVGTYRRTVEDARMTREGGRR